MADVIDRKHKGAQSELIACAYLLSLGYEVFRNVSPHGVIDVVAIKDGMIEYFDVKSVITGIEVAYLSPEAIALGIKRLVVRQDGRCEILANDERLDNSLCAYCSRPFRRKKGKQRFCKPYCRASFNIAQCV